MAGYSDYVCDLSPALQDEIVARAEHDGFELRGLHNVKNTPGSPIQAVTPS